METYYLTGTGQLLQDIHPESPTCALGCPIHSPSQHLMRSWPTHWREDRRLMERICPHGVGHPDPDHLTYLARTRGRHFAEMESLHGCDGCCTGHGPGATTLAP
jgi:hypothetical protein